jgi:hypothetical protein
VAEKPEIKPVEPDLGNSSVGNRLHPLLVFDLKSRYHLETVFLFVPESKPFNQVPAASH